MDDDLGNIFDECERYLRISLARWHRQLPDMYEDAFQEGMIQCWRDVEAGETIKLKILRRASMSANKFFHRNGEYFFGKTKKSREGLRTNSKSVEKVKAYLEETRGLREGVWPQPKTVAEALGLNTHSVQRILKDIKEGRVDHMVYREDGRMDWNFYKTMSVETLNFSSSEGTSSNHHWTDDFRFSDSWEDDTVSNMDMDSLMMKLNEKHRMILYMRFYIGYSAGYIGEFMGHTQYLSVHGNRHIKNAINQARIVLSPYEGECAAGHVRTADNTHARTRGSGIWYRVCVTCKREAGLKTSAKQKAEGFKTGRKEQEYCYKGHFKDKRDSRGTLRCSECRKEAQKKYQQAQKNKTS